MEKEVPQRDSVMSLTFLSSEPSNHRSLRTPPRAIRPREYMDCTQDIVVSDKDAKLCIKSGQTPRKREANLYQVRVNTNVITKPVNYPPLFSSWSPACAGMTGTRSPSNGLGITRGLRRGLVRRGLCMSYREAIRTERRDERVHLASQDLARQQAPDEWAERNAAVRHGLVVARNPG